MTSQESGSATSKESKKPSDDGLVGPSKAGSQLLSKFSHTDALFVKANLNPAPFAKAEIPLVRFQQLEQQIRHAPAVGQPYEELAQIYIQAERWSDARRVLDAGVRNCPDYEPIVQLYEDILISQASQFLENARNNCAENPSDQTRFDQEQAEINLINERIKVCKDRYARHPDQKELLVVWGIALRQSKRFEEAIEKLKEACVDLQLRSRASLQIAMCYQALDNPLDALSFFRRASLFRSPPPDPKIAAMALEFAAKLAEEIGLIDSAIFYLQKLQERLPNDDSLAKRIEDLTLRLPTAPEPDPPSATPTTN